MSVQRPMSPFMIGTAYKPQLTSMLSILHRITGLFLCIGAVVVIAWICALAAGPDEYARYLAFADSIFGKAIAAGSVFALLFHLGNGIRHLFWDAGLGFDLKTTYASGWTVVVFATVGTVLVLMRLGAMS